MLTAWNSNAKAGMAKYIIFFEITLSLKATDSREIIQNNPRKTCVLENIIDLLPVNSFYIFEI